jgi:hypothetical protein
MKAVCLALSGALFGLAAVAGSALARPVSYEVGGQRYTFESRDPAQVAAARKVIEAANAAAAAKAKADAERTSNGLVTVFGSQAQREAVAAESRLTDAIAEREAASSRSPAPPSVRTERPQSRAERRSKATKPPADTVARAPAGVARPEAPASNPPRPLGEETGAAQVRSVFFDMSSGIKTTIMEDGSVHEEPFDTGAFPPPVPAKFRPDAREPVPAAPEDATGSTSPPPAIGPATR